MNIIQRHRRIPAWLLALALGALLTACRQDSILGTAAVATLARVPPTVTAVTPANNAVGVPINDSVTAAFSEPMAPITGAASFTVTCAAPCVSPAGTVALDAGATNATFTPTANLAPMTTLHRHDYRGHQLSRRISHWQVPMFGNLQPV